MSRPGLDRPRVTKVFETPSTTRSVTTRSVERRGRGLRSGFFHAEVPARKSRTQEFSRIVLTAFDPLNQRWGEHLTRLDIAIDEAPPVPRNFGKRPNGVWQDPIWPEEIVADGSVVLAELTWAGLDTSRMQVPAKIVLYRQPLELRTSHPVELTQLIRKILTRQVATYLRLDPTMIDPIVSLEE